MKCPACGYENIAGMDQCTECEGDLRDLDVESPAEGLAADLTKGKLLALVPRTPVEVAPDTPIREAVRQLVSTGRNCALVVVGGEIKGILTERDLLAKVALEYDRLADRPVREVMTPDPETLGPQDTIAFGLNRMTAGGYRHVPLADGGRTLGVVSVRDVLGYMVQRYPERLALVD